MSAREQLPDPDTHVFPLFEGTTLSEADRRELRRERIRFDESLPRLQDPRGALTACNVKFGEGLVRSVGAAPAVGNGAEEYKKPGGEKREKQRKEWGESVHLSRLWPFGCRAILSSPPSSSFACIC